MTEQHPDPVNEGLAHSGQRIVQLLALATVARQAYQRRLHRLQHAQRTRQLAAERQAEQARRALFEQARSRWAPALDPTWLRQADLLRVAEAWSAALPYSPHHAAAASAVDKCEERLRRLHPHAMDHYDRFRDSGLSHLEAMREAAPFFSRDPNVRTGEPAANRQSLTEGTGAQWTSSEQDQGLAERQDHRLEQQALRIINELKTQGPEDLTPEDLRIALETATNLPGRIITRAVQQATRTTGEADGTASASAEANHRPQTTAAQAGPRTPGAARTPAEVAADDFPYDIREAISLAAQNPPEPPATGRAPQPNRTRHHRPSR
ncbi:hypothetical protein [Thermomonospora cellulosilytica]|uniref:Uncharacterized protein n=1 Tax=Thermomonospora cellulosilytica TaxID=1411118 RepID=A0A7W3MVU9_9ACTN|nr:hypothetical protein [Thermomonospora cellulosilytica]MBA9002841.1 hypothetical protein [Thermomonospora cellulosilytica]